MLIKVFPNKFSGNRLLLLNFYPTKFKFPDQSSRKLILFMNEFFDDEINQYWFQQSYSSSAEVEKPNSALINSNNDNNAIDTAKIGRESKKRSARKKYLEKLKQYANLKDSPLINIEQNCSMSSLDKRVKNRVAAKFSRNRKKLYIGVLELEEKKLQDQLSQINKEIEQTREKINQFRSSNKTSIGLYTRVQLQKKLEQILQSKETPTTDDELQIVLDSIMYRVGATGRQRMQKLNQCYKQIINLSLLALHRYILWSAAESKHIFNPNKKIFDENEQFAYKVPLILENLQQKQDELQGLKEILVSKKQYLLGLIMNFWRIKTKIQEVARKIESDIHGVREILTPIQAAKFTLLTKQYRNQQDEFLEQNLIEACLPSSKKVKKSKLQ